LAFKDEIVSTEGLQKIPLDIIHRCRREASLVGLFTSPIRRLMKVCINGGIPVDTLDSSDYEFLGLPAENFASISLHPENAKPLPTNIKKYISPHLSQAKGQLFQESLEAPIRSLFWDPLLNHFFNGRTPLRIIPEWNIRSLFPRLKARKIDYTVHFNISGVELPIFIAEISKEPFSRDSRHKDFSKQLGIMSLSCVKMARELIRKGKDPKQARVYGLWIGGPTFQFSVAFPVISKIRDQNQDLYEIQAHVCFRPEWFFDMSTPAEPQQRRSGPVVPDEEIIQGSLNLDDYVFLTAEEIGETHDIVFAPETLPNNRAPSGNNSGLDPIFPTDLNQFALKKLNWFTDCTKKRINLLLSRDSNFPNDPRTFRDNENRGLVVESVGSASGISPEKAQASQQFARPSGRPFPLNINEAAFEIIKTSFSEFEILLQLIKFPEIFPILFHFERDGQGGALRYVFEKLRGLTENSEITSLLHCYTAIESLHNCLLFSINCLYSLYLLHEDIGIVHSDLSISNIMYSGKSGRWKLIDFNQSMSITESLARSRTAGTVGFIAPESLESGIFSKASDIYSLGKVMIKIIDPILLNQIYLLETDDEDSNEEEYVRHTRTLEPLAMQFTKIMESMCKLNPSERPTAIEALEKVFNLFTTKFSMKIDPADYYILKIRNEISKKHINDSITTASSSSGSSSPSTSESVSVGPSEKGFRQSAALISTKRPASTLEEEKEPLFKGGQTIQ